MSAALPRVRDHRLDLVKWLAMLSMLIDHLRYLWPGEQWLLVIGRFAFPFFCLAIAANVVRARPGDLFNGRNARYLLWLIVFAVLSELPYRLLSPASNTFNVMPTLLLGLLLAWGVRHQSAATAPMAAAVLILAGLLNPWLMYGFFGVLLPSALLLALQNWRWWWLPVLTSAAANNRGGWLFEPALTAHTAAILLFAILAPLVGLWLMRRERLVLNVWPVHRWAYFFYPGHLLAILLVRHLL